MTFLGVTFPEATVLAITLRLATLSCAAAAVALLFSVRSDLRKTGIGIRCDFVVAGSIASKEQWISRLVVSHTRNDSC